MEVVQQEQAHAYLLLLLLLLEQVRVLPPRHLHQLGRSAQELLCKLVEIYLVRNARLT